MITESLTVPRSEFEARTGWQLKPEGACKGDVCVPLADNPAARPSGGGDDVVDIASLAEQMNLPLLHDDTHGVWALGPESIGAHVLTTVEAPNLTLPTLEGDPFELRSLLGKKVVLVAWSPY